MVRIFISAAATLAVSLGVASAAVSQVHLGLATANVGCTHGIAVSFASDVAAAYTVTATATSDKATTSAQSTWASYSVDEPEFNYKYTSPQLHTALLCDLDGNTPYTYTIGASDFAGSFVTPPRAGQDDIETVVGVVGDPGDTTNSETTLAQFTKPYDGKPIQAVLVAGDYSYANGEHNEWDVWMNAQQNLTSRVPLTGIGGNHETITSSGHLNAPPFPADHTLRAERYLGYLARIYTPLTPIDRAALRTWFSLDIGLIHFVFLDDYVGNNGTDTTVEGTAPWLAEREAQLAWVQRDLAAVDRSVTPWVIAIKHNPYYNTWGNHQCQCSSTIFEIADADACWKGTYFSGSPHSEPHCGIQAKLEDVYAQYGVNVVMAGHVHGYERTAKIYKNKMDAAKGTYYVTTGAGGNYEGHAGPRLASTKIPSWSIGANNVSYGASRVIATRTSLQTVWFANDFLNDQEAVATDGFTIYVDGNDDLSWPPTKPVPSTVAPVPITTAPPPTTVAPVPTTAAPVPTTVAPVPTTVAPVPTTTAPVPTTTVPEPTRQSC